MTNHTNQNTIETYNNSVEAFVEATREVGGELRKWIDDSFASIDTSARILEVGSGTGKDARYIESLGYRVERTDASQGFVEYLKDQGVTARLLNVLTDELGVDYDVIYANTVFLHFTEEQMELALQKTHEALKVGGWLFMVLKAGEGEEVSDRKVGSDRYFHYWQQDEVEAVLTANGFTDIKTTVDAQDRADGHALLMTVARKREA